MALSLSAPPAWIFAALRSRRRRACCWAGDSEGAGLVAEAEESAMTEILGERVVCGLWAVASCRAECHDTRALVLRVTSALGISQTSNSLRADGNCSVDQQQLWTTPHLCVPRHVYSDIRTRLLHNQVTQRHNGEASRCLLLRCRCLPFWFDLCRCRTSCSNGVNAHLFSPICQFLCQSRSHCPPQFPVEPHC
jgi:hypothetical protein